MSPEPTTTDRPRPVTYHDAQDAYQSIIDAREQFEELTLRDLMTRAYETLQAHSTYDPQRHGAAEKYQPLTPAEHLEGLALGEVLARYYRHPASVHYALKAGASWEQVAGATGGGEDRARHDYREWAEGQHRLWTDYEGKFGLNADEYAAAIALADGG